MEASRAQAKAYLFIGARFAGATDKMQGQDARTLRW